jgi:hypothetical protein
MADWRYVIALPATSGITALAELTEALDRRVAWRLGDAADASFALDARHELATLVDELTTDLAIYRDDQLQFRGRLGTSNDDIAGDKHRVTYTAVDYTSLLARRILTTPQAPWTFTGIAQGSIVRQLIAWTQGTTGGALGISATSTTVPDTATTRTITFDPAKSIAEAIDDLANLENGFDFWVDAGLVAHLASPQRGTGPRDLIAELGSTVSKVQRAFDPAEYGNAIMVTGKSGTAPVFATAGNLATRPEGRLDALESFPDIASTTVLQARANQALTERSSVRPAYTCTMVPGVWRPGDLWLGDSTYLVVQSGRLDFSVLQRVSEIGVDLSDDGAEEVKVTFDTLPPKLARRVRQTNRRLERVERLA